MRALIVTAFYDIGRGDYAHMSRSVDQYVDSFKMYVGRLEPEKYILCEEATAPRVKDVVDVVDILPFEQTEAAKFLPRTREVMNSPAFRALFDKDDDTSRLEHIVPEYNIAMMIKCDALERAARKFGDAYSHYCWMDFGLGRRATATPWLPEPEGFHPILRDRIVISARRRLWWWTRRITRRKIEWKIANFSENAAGSAWFLPRDKVQPFVDLMRKQYQQLLDWNLTTDDQTVLDMCTMRHPELFHIVPSARRVGRFRNLHAIISGKIS